MFINKDLYNELNRNYWLNKGCVLYYDGRCVMLVQKEVTDVFPEMNYQPVGNDVIPLLYGLIAAMYEDGYFTEDYT